MHVCNPRQKELEFDIPFRELAFPGVPYKTSSMVLPTVNCLVDLIETPFLVVTLKEIEVVNLERVGFALKNFDMAIVFKDFTREVHRIDAIDTKNLDTIKEWLNSVGIKYYESKMNLNWKPILKTILVCLRLRHGALVARYPAADAAVAGASHHAGRPAEVCRGWGLGLPGP